MPHRNAASVLPEPVGAQISVLAPAAIFGQPCAWAGVGAANEASNQRRTGSENGSRGDSAVGFARVANPPMLRRVAAGGGPVLGSALIPEMGKDPAPEKEVSMVRRLHRPPSPALVVATLALVLAIGGGAYAVTISGKQVKRIATKIANGQIAARAPRLSVKHARKADDASKLGGRLPAAYLDRVAHSASGRATVGLPPGATVDITAGAPPSLVVPPDVGFVQVEGFASDFGVAAASKWTLWIQADGPCQNSGPAFDDRVYGYVDGPSDQETLSQQFVFAVAPGPHTYRLCAASDQASSVTSRTLIARTIAGGAGGSASAAAAKPAGPAAAKPEAGGGGAAITAP